MDSARAERHLRSSDLFRAALPQHCVSEGSDNHQNMPCAAAHGDAGSAPGHARQPGHDPQRLQRTIFLVSLREDAGLTCTDPRYVKAVFYFALVSSGHQPQASGPNARHARLADPHPNSISTMKRRDFVISALSPVFARELRAAPGSEEQPGWSKYFQSSNAQGTAVVVDARGLHEATFVFDTVRASRRYTPASTFKIAHSLFALDAGIVRDEFHKFPWDGVQRASKVWNADQDLRSAMRNSTVWVFERIAVQLGTEQEIAYLSKIDYGNALVSGEAPFWVEGDLAISAHEQIRFLRALYRNELPFRVDHQRLVKDVLINEAGPGWILRAKSGWSGKIGLWVGWVEWPTGPVFFALNIDTPNRLADLPKRFDIMRNILRSIDALPRG